MKKCVCVLCFCLSAVNAFATAYCSLSIKVNNNFTIALSVQDYYVSDYTDGLYFDLIVWAKNVEKELANVNGGVWINCEFTRIYIRNNDIDTEYALSYNTGGDSIEVFRVVETNYILEYKYRWDSTKGMTAPIITKLNTFFKINGRYGNLNSVELFVKNNRENEAKDSYSSKIYCDYIYLNREELTKDIKKEKDSNYFIETIRINRRNVDNIITIESYGCG